MFLCNFSTKLPRERNFVLLAAIASGDNCFLDSSILGGAGGRFSVSKQTVFSLIRRLLFQGFSAGLFTDYFLERRPAKARKLPTANNTTVAGSGIGTGISCGSGGSGSGSFDGALRTLGCLPPPPRYPCRE